MDLQIKTPPATEPLSYKQVQYQIGICHDADIDWIENDLIPSARQWAETSSRRQFLTATWEMYLDCLPLYDWPIKLPLGQFQALNSITYLDEDDVRQTIDTSTDVILYGGPDYKRIHHVDAWPRGKDVIIEFACGYGDNQSSVPPGFGRAMSLMAKHYWDEGRQNVVIGATVNKVPGTAEDIITQHALGNEFTTFDPASQMYRI